MGCLKKVIKVKRGQEGRVGPDTTGVLKTDEDTGACVCTRTRGGATTGGHRERTAVCTPRREASADPACPRLDLGLPASATVREKCTVYAPGSAGLGHRGPSRVSKRCHRARCLVQEAAEKYRASSSLRSCRTGRQRGGRLAIARVPLHPRPPTPTPLKKKHRCLWT